MKNSHKTEEDPLQEISKFNNKVVDSEKSETLHKQTKRALEESEEKFRLIGENTTDFISIVGLDGKYIYVSPSYKLLGYDPDKLIGSDGFKLLHPDDRKRLRPLIKQVVSGLFKKGTTRRFEIRLLDKSGKYRDTESIVKLIKDDIGKFRILSVVRDITERKQAERVLSNSEEQFRNMFESNHAIMLLIDPVSGKIMNANPAACKYYGYSNKKFINELYIQNINTLSDRDIKNEMQIAVKEKRNYFVFKHKLANGIIRDVEVYSSKTIYQGKSYLYSIIHDTTDRIHAQNALIEKEARIKSIFRSAPVGIGVVSNRIFLEVNDCLCEMTGYSKDELVNKNSRMLYVTKKEFDYVGKEKYEQIEKYGTGTVETRFKRKDGKFLNIILSSTPIDIDNLSKGVTFAALNITERKHAEDKIKFLSEITQQARDSIITTDLNFKITWVNNAFSKLFGYKFEEIIGKQPDLLNAEPLSAKYQKKIYNTVTAGKGFKGEALNIKKDGSVFQCELEIFPMLDKNDSIIAYSGHLRDITERKLAEDTLRNSENQYRQFFNEDLSGAFISTPEGKLIECNQAFLDIFGYSDKKNALKDSTYKLYDEEDQRDKKLEILREKKKLINYEEKLKNVKGKTIYVVTNMKGEFDSDGKLIFLKGYLIDITKQRIAEKELKRKNDGLQMSNDLFVGRKLKMIELKKEINELLEAFGKKPKYKIIG